MSTNQHIDHNREGGWPLSALVSLLSLVVAIAALWFAFNGSQQALQQLNDSLTQQHQQHAQMMAEWQENLTRLQTELRDSRGFIMRQQHYARFMGLLSELYVHTVRQEPAALEEVQYRLKAEFNALEPFLVPGDRQWLHQQLNAIMNLSHRLAEPLQDYEENLLASGASLRNLIDEAHEKSYGMLFGNAVEE